MGEVKAKAVGITPPSPAVYTDHEQEIIRQQLVVGGPNLRRRKAKGKVFYCLALGTTLSVIGTLIFLLTVIAIEGSSWLDFQFLTSFASRIPARAGIKAALFGSIWLLLLTAFIAVPLGVMAGTYIEELMPRGKLYQILVTNLRNLAGVPSIVYGILGLSVFVQFFGFGRSLLSGALTMSLLIFPIIIIATCEALQSTPNSLRQAAAALGATRWQTVRHHVLPISTPGIMTGVILGLSRVVGEAAPLILVGAVSFIAFVPEHPMESYSALPIQIYNWVSRPKQEFHQLAAAGIIVLLILMLTVNATAILLRNYTQRKNLCQKL